MKQEFNVIRTEKGLSNQKSSFVINYNGHEEKVPMYNFQVGNPDIKTIRCNVGNGYITQDLQTVTDTFYSDRNKSYLFRVKRKWDTLKYYELKDSRFNEEYYRLIIPFSDSTENLGTGQYIKCKIKDIVKEKPHLILVDADPSLIEFIKVNSVFDFDNDSTFEKWIHSIFKEDVLKTVDELYENEDGRWICQFAKEIRFVIYHLLLSDIEEKKDLLTIFCQGWIHTIEHSSFINSMSEKENLTYRKPLSTSIEICEDFLDAQSLLQDGQNVADIIKSLNPNYFQYRIERKLRFIAFAFSTNKEMLKKAMPDFLGLLREMGEEKCCSDDIYMSIVNILKMYANLIVQNTINMLSIPMEETDNIKNGILSLCYLVKILDSKNDKECPIYISRIFLLNSFIVREQDKPILLKNAYLSLFSRNNPISQFKWKELENIIQFQRYKFCQEMKATSDENLDYNHESVEAKFSERGMMLSPKNYDGTFADFRITEGLQVKVCSEKKDLTHFNENFLEVQNAWKDVMTTVFTPIIGKMEKKERLLLNGETVEIYITDILDERTALCKVWGHQIEGTISFKDMFFYDKPNLHITDFMGSNNSPLVFLAEYRIENDGIKFNAENYKNEFLKDTLQEGSEVQCRVISVNSKSSCVCITDSGIRILVNSMGVELKKYDYITAVVNRITDRGAIADFSDYLEEEFDSYQVYSKYLKLLNRYEYDDELTIADIEETSEERPQTSSANIVTQGQVNSIIDILARISLLEDNLKIRYGILYICRILSKLNGDIEQEEYFSMRLQYTKLLYTFSLNSKLTESELQPFKSIADKWKEVPEVKERMNILSILNRLGRWWNKNESDAYLINKLTDDCSVLEKELSKLVLSSCLLYRYDNDVLRDKIMDEIGKLLNITIIRHNPIHIGEESQTQEFKTSLVYPPNNRGNEDIEQQSDNIIRVIISMMNTKGGILYIGVNDNGNVVGIHNDLAYFSEKKLCDENKAKDEFKNYFSNLLTKRLDAIHAAKFDYDFEYRGDYTIFRITIPEIHDQRFDYFKRVGSTVQKMN